MMLSERDFVESIAIYLDNHNIEHAEEVRMGIGIPDIALSIGTSCVLEPLDDYYLVQIMEYIGAKRKVPISKLQEVFSSYNGRLNRYLSELVTKGFIEIEGGYIIRRKSLKKSSLGKAVSIEVKLREWREGLLQARRYLAFSDYAYLAIPSDKITNTLIAEAKQYGIGVLGLQEGCFEEVINPELSDSCDEKMKYLIISAIRCNSKPNTTRKRERVFSKLAV